MTAWCWQLNKKQNSSVRSSNPGRTNEGLLMVQHHTYFQSLPDLPQEHLTSWSDYSSSSPLGKTKKCLKMIFRGLSHIIQCVYEPGLVLLLWANSMSDPNMLWLWLLHTGRVRMLPHLCQGQGWGLWRPLWDCWSLRHWPQVSQTMWSVSLYFQL